MRDYSKVFSVTNTLHQPDATTLRDMLQAARERTLAYAGALQPDQWLGPYLKIVNPPLWEIGHLGWFQEHWCLRYPSDGAAGTPGMLAPSMLPDADARYNSAIVPHAERWHLKLPTPGQTLDYLRDVQDAVLARLAREGATPHLRYFVQLAVFHEEMHNEAFHYTCQTLGHGNKNIIQNQILADIQPKGDAAIAGGAFMLGASRDDGFVFDNEKWAHPVQVPPFRMARTAVSNGEFAAFVDAGGYTRREWWSEAGWHWREQAQATTPLYWTRLGGRWHARRFEQTVALEPDAGLLHVNWFEAHAYCAWARRRLPSEAEWEFAAATAPGDLLHKRRYPWGDVPPTPAHAHLFWRHQRHHRCGGAACG